MLSYSQSKVFCTVVPVASLSIVFYRVSRFLTCRLDVMDVWLGLCFPQRAGYLPKVSVQVALCSLSFWCLVSLGLWPWQPVIQGLP